VFFRQILHEEKSCLSYMVGCPSQGVCAVIDAQGNPESYAEIAESKALKITGIFETHVQADHLSASMALAKLVNAPVYFGPEAIVNFPHKALGDGNIVEIGRRKIKALHTPGHTKEHVCLLVDDWLVFTGDTLFVGDVGRVDLSADNISTKDVEERAENLFDSIQGLLKLPDITEVYPGHYRGSSCGKGMDSKPSSTIGRERQKNPVLKLNKQDFVKYLFDDMPPPPPNFKQIKTQNSNTS
jgi:hydroxyacylglutathione hydrolase